MKKTLFLRICCLFLLLASFCGTVFGQDLENVMGTIRVVVLDDFSNDRTTSEVLLETADKNNNEATFTKLSFLRAYEGGKVRFKPEDFQSGDWVKLSGYKSEKDEFVITEVLEKKKYEDKQPAPMAQRTSMYVLVDLTDAKVSDRYTPAAMSQMMDKVAVEYNKLSFSKLTFLNDANGSGTNDVYGPVQIDASKTTCNYVDYANKALTILRAQGVNLSLYQHQVFMIPPETSCSWLGLAWLSCGNNCQAWIRSPDNVPVVTHELGHNFNMHHAATDLNDDGTVDSEYRDHSCVMGNDLGNNKGLNAPHALQMGWTEASKVQEISAAGTYKISPLHLPASQAASPQVLKIKKVNQYYFLSFRQRALVDLNLKAEYTTGVSIHKHLGGTNKTMLVKSMLNGESFAIDGYTVKQVSADASGATVAISGGCASQTAPQVSLQKGVMEIPSGGYDTNFVRISNSGSCEVQFNADLSSSAGLTGSLHNSTIKIAPGTSAQLGMTITPKIASGRESFTINLRQMSGTQVVATHSLQGDVNVGASTTYSAGLNAKFYAGTWGVLPNFDTLTPYLEGVTSKIDNTGANRTENYGKVSRGYLKIDVQGLYTFYLTSDDGSKLYINGYNVISNDGSHGAIEKSGNMYLYPGYYPIRVDFFQGGGPHFLSLQYQSPGYAKREIPATAYFRVATVAPSKVMLKAKHSGKCIAVGGASSNSGIPYNQVTCNGANYQKFDLVANGDGSHLIKSFVPKCTDVQNASTADRASIVQNDCVNSASQKFFLRPQTDGTYIIGTFSGKCLDIYGASQSEGAAVIQYSCSGSNNQRFYIVN